MEALAALAREAHAKAAGCDAEASRFRALRDDSVRRLRTEDPARWTYAALAKAIGCSPELIAKILTRSGADG